MARKSAARASAENAQDALYRAQELIYEVWEAKTAKQRIALAEKALAISPLCADAYVLLAEHSKPDSDEALDSWRRGVEAGTLALGEDFEEFWGEFWGFLETRPYMRARFGLAWALWLRGARDEAIDHLRDMLELNPGDNQGVRYVLAGWLLEARRDDELFPLLQAYEGDGSAIWAWTGVLANFRRTGDTQENRRLLLDAFMANKHVPAYLLGERAMPKQRSPFISIGGEDEAVHYVTEYADGWQAAPGALEWLRAKLPVSKAKDAKPKAAAKPRPKAKPKAAAKAKTAAAKG
jgi:tetratricopeptide (TPR) repeat protein